MIYTGKTLLGSTSIKADLTSSIRLATMEELTDQEYLGMCKWHKNKEEITVVLAILDSPEYITFITEEATRIADGL